MGRLRSLPCKEGDLTHHVSRTLTDRAHMVGIEDLHAQGMTRSAQGTVAAPGRNVKATSDLHRNILASGWRQREQRLAYQCRRLILGTRRIHQPDLQPMQLHRQSELARAMPTGTWRCTAWGEAISLWPAGPGRRRGALPLGPPGTYEQDMPESVHLGI